MVTARYTIHHDLFFPDYLMQNLREFYNRCQVRFTHSYRLQVLFNLWAVVLTILVYVVLFYHYYPEYEGREITIMDSFLFVFETITTVGYGDFGPFVSDEMTLIAILIMITGIVLFFSVLNLIITPIIQSRIQPDPPRKLPYAPSGHIVIFGYSPMIQEAVQNFRVVRATVVVVEAQKDRALELVQMLGTDILVIQGDYHEASTWNAAHIHDAGYVIISLNEWIAARIILGIRAVSRAEIIALISDVDLEKYLRISGADHVISSKKLLADFAVWHALMSIEPGQIKQNKEFGDLIEKTSTALGNCSITRIPVVKTSRAIGKRIGDLPLMQQYNHRIFAIILKGEVILSPSYDLIIEDTMVLFCIGTADNISQLLEDEFIIPHETPISTIIAGYGDIGKMIISDLQKMDFPCLTIDPSSERNPSVVGNAEREEILLRAGIDDAGILMVVTNDDDANLFTTLMARNLNPELTIFSRANDPDSVPWMYKAGVNFVINIPSVIAQALGRLILYGSSEVLLNLQGGYQVAVRYYDIRSRSSLSVEKIAFRTGCRILVVEHGGVVHFPSPSGLRIFPGDAVYALGTHEQIRRFIRYI